MARLIPTPSWQARVGRALLLLLGVAIGSRVIGSLLTPLVPVLVAAVITSTVIGLLFRGRR